MAVGGNGAPAVLGELETLLPGWSPRQTDTGATDITLSIDTEPSGFRFTEQPRGTVSWEPDSFSAAYALATELFERLVAGSTQGLVLHAGAAVLGGCAMAFAAPTMTGKSTLGAAFSLAGERLLGDERIIARLSGSSPEAIPLGLAQKLRLPIPDTLEPRFRPLLDRRPGRRIADSLFLEWDPETQVTFGEAVPLGGIVILTRDGSVSAACTRVPKARAIREILGLSATPAGPSQHLEVVRALVEQLPVLEVRYGSCFDAREKILDAAGAWG
jgi:hypothetical protein